MSAELFDIERSYNRIVQTNEKPLDDWLILNYEKYIVNRPLLKLGHYDQIAKKAEKALGFKITSHNVKRRHEVILMRQEASKVNAPAVTAQPEADKTAERLCILEQNFASLSAKYDKQEATLSKLCAALGEPC